MKQFHLSTYISLAISLLVIISTVIVSTVLYFSLKKSLTSEFEDRVKAEGGEVAQVIRNRLDTIDSRLTALSLDNTIRITLMLGADQQLQEHLHNLFKNSCDTHVFIFKKTNPQHSYTVSKLNLDAGKISRFISEPSQRSILEYVPSHGYTLTRLLPISRQKNRIGTLVGVYLFREDKHLKDFFERKRRNKVIYYDGTTAWDLFSGRKYTLAGDLAGKASGDRLLSYLKMGDENVVASPISGLPGLYCIATMRSLNEATKRVSYLVIIPATMVVLLTVLISYYLSWKLSRPLFQISELAQQVAEGNFDLPKGISTSNIYEVEHLMKSLRTMLDDLRQVQELQRYQELFEGVADMVLIHDYSGQFIKVNRIALTVLGISEKDITATNLYAISEKNAHRKIRACLQYIELNQDEKTFETTLQTKNGEYKPVECHARSALYHNKKVVLNLVRDISERKLAEKSLRESHQTLVTILDSIEATIYASDLDTYEILFFNKYMKECFSADLEGKVCYEAFRNTSSPCRHCTNNKLVGADGEPTGVVIWEGENPITQKWYINYDRAIQWIDGRLVRFQVAFDITAMKELEKEREQSKAQLAKIKKMEAIGTLAGGVAHDLNNILTGIVSYPDLLLAQLPEKSPLKGPIMTIKKTGQKATAIVQDLLTLARRGVVINEVVDLNQIVSDYLNSPEHIKILSFHKKVRIETNLEDDLLNILGSPVHLSKSIMNLVANAAEAMPGGGVITISTETLSIDKPFGNYEEVKSGEYVHLSLADTGSGMSVEDSEKIFEPFFTKKIMGRSGTGLGMSVVWGTVKDHEGYIDINTEVGKGTTFSLYFPVTRQKLIKEQLSSSIQDYKGNNESILVVDDVEEQRNIAQMIFTELGYSVNAVPSGEEAIAYIKKYPVDLILLDMIMDPGIDGLETYQRILGLYPGQKAIIASGYSETDRIRKARELGARQYIKKPYTLKEIAQAVKKEFD